MSKHYPLEKTIEFANQGNPEFQHRLARHHLARTKDYGEAKKFAAIVERQKTNPIDISVYLSERTERFFSPIQYGKLCEKVHENVFSADVANRTIYGNECFTLFKNPIIKLMEKAEKLANKQSKTNSYIDNCLKV